jgi:hypothetical protein
MYRNGRCDSQLLEILAKILDYQAGNHQRGGKYVAGDHCSAHIRNKVYGACVKSSVSVSAWISPVPGLYPCARCLNQTVKEICKNEPTPDEEQRILNSPPTGTFALMLLVGALIVAGWAYMFFFMFLEHGPVN